MSEQITGGRRGMMIQPDYGRLDRSVSRMDMRVRPTKDMGVVDAVIPMPSEYVPYGQCPETVTFLGQVTGDGASVPNGGHPVFEPFDRNYNSGLESVFTRLPESSGSRDPEPVTVDIQVDRATVVATRPKDNPDGSISTSRGRFWVADGRRTMEMFLNLTQGEATPFEVKVGQIISFKAITIGYFGLRPQIQRARDFVLHDDGPAHATIARAGNVAIMDNPPLTTDDIPKVVRVTGILEGEPVRCSGNYNCWQLSGPQDLIYRTETDDLRPGTCITFVGPVSGFGEQVQLEAFNPTWVKRYQVGGAFEEACQTDRDCASGVCVTLGADSFCSMECMSDSDCPTRYDCTFNRCLPSFGSDCPEAVAFKGQYQGVMSTVPNGGQFSLEPYPETFRANLATVMAQAPAAATSNPEPVVTEILVDGAVVTSTYSGEELIGPDSDREIPASQARFTLGDGTGNVEVFLDLGAVGATPQSFRVRTGMVVSLTATQLDRYQGKVQIKRAVWNELPPADEMNETLGGRQGDCAPEGAVFSSPCWEQVKIAVFEPDREFSRTDLNRIVRVTGTLEGEGDRCGDDYRCWTLNYGYGEPVVVRSFDEDAYTGACVTFTGPLGFYNGNYQLNAVNPDWLVVNDGE